jgi:hypothetical protein
MDQDEMSNLYRGHSIDASYQISVHFGDEMSNLYLYRGPSIDASYHVSVHLAEGFQRRRLKFEKLMDDGSPMEGSVLSFLKAE